MATGLGLAGGVWVHRVRWRACSGRGMIGLGAGLLSVALLVAGVLVASDLGVGAWIVRLIPVIWVVLGGCLLLSGLAEQRRPAG